jgi:hypothetical protein
MTAPAPPTPLQEVECYLLSLIDTSTEAEVQEGFHLLWQEFVEAQAQ